MCSLPAPPTDEDAELRALLLAKGGCARQGPSGRSSTSTESRTRGDIFIIIYFGIYIWVEHLPEIPSNEKGCALALMMGRKNHPNQKPTNKPTLYVYG